MTLLLDAPKNRLTSRDPLGFSAGDANLYRFVGNDPTTFTDPSGLQRQKSNDDAFRDAGRRNGVPDEVIELMLKTARETTCEKPSRWETHNYCEKWADRFANNLRDELSKHVLKKNPPKPGEGLDPGLKSVTGGGITGPPEKVVWFVPGSFPIFAPDQDHTTMKVTFKDGSVFYIDCGTVSAMNINNLTGGPSHVGLPEQIPPSWEKYPRTPKAGWNNSSPRSVPSIK